MACDFWSLQKGGDGRKASPAWKGAAASRVGVFPGASAQAALLQALWAYVRERKTWAACTSVLEGGQ